MRQVPYHGNPGNACALACYTMVAQYLLPDRGITFEQLGKIADWQKGYVVWAFPVWAWLMNQGVHIADYDLIDYDAWAERGLEGLRESVSQKEFEFYRDNTKDLEKTAEQAKLTLSHPNFHYIQRSATWDDVLREFGELGICDLTLESRTLNRLEGFSVHRVVLIDITETEVVFHDPNKDGTGAYRREPIDHFRSAFEALDAPEIARYWLES